MRASTDSRSGPRSREWLRCDPSARTPRISVSASVRRLTRRQSLKNRRPPRRTHTQTLLLPPRATSHRKSPTHLPAYMTDVLERNAATGLGCRHSSRCSADPSRQSNTGPNPSERGAAKFAMTDSIVDLFRRKTRLPLLPEPGAALAALSH